MSELQVLVATMNQSDFSLVDKMNIRCDTVIANQSNEDYIKIKETEHGKIKMITTATRGVGLNRNLALLAADAEIVLFADDDVTYYDGTLQGVKDAFKQLPEADAIIFSLDLTQNGVVTRKSHLTRKRLHIWNSLKFGACVIAVRRISLIKSNVTFSQLFGGGCIYGSGEDSLFIADCFSKRLKMYSHEYVLGTCNKDSSSWFTGFNEKYFFDKGAWIGFAFPRLKLLFLLIFGFRFRKRTDMTLRQIIYQMYRGMRAAKRLEPYSEE